MTRTLLRLGAVGEGATGLILMVAPAIFIRWLLGAELSEAGLVLGRLGGFALLAFGIACWPDARPGSSQAASFRGLLTYSLLATLYLLRLGLGGKLVGRLLWPAVMLHVVYTLLLGWAWLGRSRGHQPPGVRTQTDRAR